MYQRKKDHYPSSVLAMISVYGGVACIILFRIASTDWLDFVVYAYLSFFSLAVLLGSYSLLIKRNARAWTAVVCGLVFLILFAITAYLFSKICIIC